jgi:outer membrane receptor protein involved in Fe transport
MKFSSLLKFIFVLFFIHGANLYAQKGIIRGTVIDDLTGETVIAASVQILGTQSGTTTDIDGNFELSLAPGTYSLLISYLSYASITIKDIVITADKVEVVNVRMKEETQLMQEVVVTAKQIKNTESAIATIKQKAPSMIDGISSQTIKRTGDGNAGEALRRVTGVAMEGGKYAVIRGLGDRYTKVTFNGVEMPGLDPDRNAVPTDLFPTNIVDNLIVYKTFSPELSGDFSGGAIDIQTKDFPQEKSLNATISIGYNPSMHFNNDFLSYNGGKLDWLGMDDGTRALPFYKKTVIPDPSIKSPLLTSITKEFNPEMAATKSKNNLNKTIGLSGGNQIKLFDGELGYIFGINYQQNYNHYDNFEFGEYFRNANNEGYFINRETRGTLSESNVLLSGLGGLTYKKGNHRIGLDVFRIQNGESKATKLKQSNLELNSSVIQRDNLEYAQREITTIILNGKHTNKTGNFHTKWSVSPTFIEMDEPDIRTSGFDISNGEAPILRPSVGAEVARIYRNLKENDLSGRLDFTLDLKNKKDLVSKIKFGAYAINKKRDFEILNYIFRVNNQLQLNINGDPNNLFKNENIWNVANGTGTYVLGNFEPANTFSASQRNISGYVMHENKLSSKFKLTYGLRVENQVSRYTGVNNQGNLAFNNQKIFDKLSFLPSMNMVYELKENTNLRMAYNRTVARPTFKENSIAQIQDRITDRTFLGNLGLKQTDIDNVDLRIEKYFKSGQLISLSTFYKYFKNPIQLAVFDQANPTNFTPKNFDKANVYGVELEMNQNLGQLSSTLSLLSVSANYTYTKTDIPLVGLSPQVFNVILVYNKADFFDASVSYNVQAPKLAIVGSGRIEDIYEKPFKSLNVKLSKTIKGNSISFFVENLLNSQKVRSYNTNDNTLAVFDKFVPGVTYNITTSFKLN